MKHLLTSLLGALGLTACAAVSPMSPADFTQAVAEAYRATTPGSEITVVADLQLKIKPAQGNETTAFLDNAYAEYLRSPKDKRAIIERYVQSYKDIPQGEFKLDPSMIVPVVKDRAWLEEVERAAEARGLRETDDKLFEDLNGDLVIVYAEDSPTNIRYFSGEDLIAAGIDRKSLRALAVANLRRILPQVEIHRGPHVSMLTAGGDYEASLLLLDELWEPKKLGLKGEIVLAVPSRDVVLVAGSEDAEGVRQLRELARKNAKENTYSLTDTVFVHSKGVFRRLDN